jgi:hypothetical protein
MEVIMMKISNEEYQERLNNYSKVNWKLVGEYRGGNRPVTLLCEKCGKTRTHSTAKNVFKIKNCANCSPKYFKKTHEQVQEDIAKFDLILVGEYVDDTTLVDVKFPCGHIHKKRPTLLKQGYGVRCLLCEPRSPSTRTPLDEMNTKLENAEFGRFKIVGEYEGATRSTNIECLDCGFVEQDIKPNNLLKRAGGCQLCGKLQRSESVNHRFIKRVLYDLDLTFVLEKSFEGLVSDKKSNSRFDFFLPEYNTLIEYDGEYHETRDNYGISDRMKDEYCLSNNIKLIRLNHRERGYILKILSSIKCND